MVYLAARVGAIVGAGLPWIATDGNATNATTEFCADLRTLDTMVDWPLMLEKMWHNTPDNPDRQRRRMAEFLVHGQVPLTAIHQIGVYGEQQAAATRETLSGTHLATKVFVRREWYYGYERRR